MYFWNITALKAKLRDGGLSQEQIFLYILIEVTLYTVVVVLEFANTSSAASVNEWTYLSSLVNVTIVIIGMIWLYRANGGGAGRDFSARFFSLGFVAMNRFFVFGFIPFIAAVIAYVILTVGPEGELSKSTGPGEIVLAIVFVAAYLAYFAKCIRDVAKA